MDGYSSHLLPRPLEILAQNKIEVVKEEGDSSQTNQAYDQIVAKKDKQKSTELLDVVRSMRKKVVNQWDLILICIHAFRKVGPEAWITSFKRVNLHPDHRLPFDEWIKKIESQIKTGEQFFVKRNGLFDAMPACWKNLSVEDRHTICSKIDRFYKEAKDEGGGASPWKTANIYELLPYVALDDIPKIRSSYLTTKTDPSVFVEPPKVDLKIAAEEKTTAKGMDEYAGYTWEPKELREKFVQSKTTAAAACPVVSKKWFDHMANHVDKTVNYRAGEKKRVSAYLDVATNEEQLKIFEPSPADVCMSVIFHDTVGQGAVRKICKRKIDAMSGNINSYCRSLNNPAQLEMIRDYTRLGSSLSMVEAELEGKKKAAAEKKKGEEAAKRAKKAEEEEKQRKKKEQLMPALTEWVEKGLETLQEPK